MRTILVAWGLTLLSLGAMAQTVGPFTPDGHTLALYHFDAKSGDQAVDSGPKGNHGKIAGAKRVKGLFGGALKFDGVDDQVVVPNHPSLKNLKQLTVEAWIRMVGHGGRQFICGKDAEWHFDISEEGGGIGLSLYSNGGKQHRRTGTGGFYYPPFQWTHVAATYDGRQVKFFQNGVLMEIVPGPEGFLLTSNQPLLIGAYRAMRYYFGGCIDELRVSDCVRYDPKNTARKKQRVFSPAIPTTVFCKVTVPQPKKTGLWRIEATLASQSASKTSGLVFLKRGAGVSVPVGRWEIKGEKDAVREITIPFDVSDEVAGPGRYNVIFRATGGGPVRIVKVCLASKVERVESKSLAKTICTRYDMDAAFDVSFGKAVVRSAGDMFRLAREFDFCTGKINLIEEDEDKRCPMVTGHGSLAYYIDFPRDGAYDIYLKYATKSRKPLDATLDDVDINRFDPFTNSATGGMFLKDAFWEYQGTCVATAGVHSLVLSGYFPSMAAILLRPTNRRKPATLGPERGVRPNGDLLSGQWEVKPILGKTDGSSVQQGPDGALTVRYRFANVDKDSMLADDVFVVCKEVFWNLSATGELRFKLRGDGSNHLLRVILMDAKGDVRLIGQTRLTDKKAREMRWPVTFEGNFICDGTSIAQAIFTVCEANISPTKISQGEVKISDMCFVFRDELASVPLEKSIPMPEGERAERLKARCRSVCVTPVVPEDYPTFQTANPKPVTRKTLGYQMHATGSRSFSKETLDKFHKQYWFGDVTWPNISNIYRKDMKERVADIMGRGLFIFDLWGYVPNRNPGGTHGWTEYHISDELHEYLLKTCGDRFLGYDDGEQDGRYIGSYAGRSKATTRKEAFDDFDKWDSKIRKSQQHFLVSTGSLNFCHYYGHFGCIMLGLETAQGLPSDSLLFAFLRGACKEYGRLWHQGISVWSRYGYKLYNRREVMPGGNKPGYGCGPTKGASASLMKRLWYVGYLGGCSIAGTETAQFTARTLPDGRPELSPIGRMDVKGVKWVAEHPDRGEQYTPVAAMLDFYNGWNMPRHLYRRDRYKIWGKFDYEKSDYMIDNFFRMVLPGYEDCSYFRNGRGFLCETPYGDIVDVLDSRTPPYVLKRYDAIVLLGGVQLEGGLLKRLQQWVSGGGDLFVCTAQAKGVGEMFLGVKPTGRQGKATGALSLADGVLFADQQYTYDIVQLAGARALAINEEGHPVVTAHNFGKGRVVCIAADFGMTDAIKYRYPDLVN
ncbi:MAG: hypothetical protein GXP25_15195, partial [Planctomycetes bacterium]|nr:hypothetical protein [Planctomycetota bacterium]